MGSAAGFHADKAGREFAEELDQLLAPQLSRDNDLAALVDAMDLKNVLGEINADSATCMWTTPPGDSLLTNLLGTSDAGSGRCPPHQERTKRSKLSCTAQNSIVWLMAHVRVTLKGLYPVL